MSARIFTLILVASLTPGMAFAKKAERKLVNEDRYLYAQPDAVPTSAHTPVWRPSETSASQPDDRDANSANGG